MSKGVFEEKETMRAKALGQDSCYVLGFLESKFLSRARKNSRASYSKVKGDLFREIHTP